MMKGLRRRRRRSIRKLRRFEAEGIQLQRKTWWAAERRRCSALSCADANYDDVVMRVARMNQMGKVDSLISGI